MSKKRAVPKEDEEANSVVNSSMTTYTKTVCINKKFGNNSSKQRKLFFNWKLGTINIRTGQEQSEGARLYMITKQVAEAGLLICSLQEVRYRNSGKKIINLDSGVSYVFFWSGPKKRRDAGVGILIKQCKDVTYNDPDIMDSRIMGMNAKIKGYDVRLVNTYAPTNCDGSESAKDVFYKTLRKACVKQYKHQKLIVNGDFNATTELVTKQCYYDGKRLVDDPICNENGLRLKQFCQEKQLCTSQLYFEHALEVRHTWFSGDRSTKKVLDYILVEPYTQQFMEECKVDIKYDFDSDHRLVTSCLATPTTKKARRKFSKSNQSRTIIDPKSLDDTKIKAQFIEALSNELNKAPELDRPDDIGSDLAKCLQDAASATLSNKKKNTETNEIWKNDKTLNFILETRKRFVPSSLAYKYLTKTLKKRVNKLKNEKLAKEALEINKYATNRDVENLYRSFISTLIILASKLHDHPSNVRTKS